MVVDAISSCTPPRSRSSPRENDLRLEDGSESVRRRVDVVDRVPPVVTPSVLEEEETLRRLDERLSRDAPPPLIKALNMIASELGSVGRENRRGVDEIDLEEIWGEEVLVIHQVEILINDSLEE